MTEEEKLQEEKERVLAALQHLNRWEDIPVPQQLGSVCELLCIRPNEAAEKYVMGLCFLLAYRTDEMLEKEARTLMESRSEGYYEGR